MILIQLVQALGEDGGGGIAAAIGGLLYLAFLALMIASLWTIFTKAGEPGWAAIIPIYNIIVLLKIVGRPIWWLVLMLIPFVNFIIGILVMIDLAKSFGQGAGFGVGMVFLPFIFAPMLAFGDSRYSGPSAS
jgi:hypothetical protein